LRIHPASTVLHYGSEIFEGMKAYRNVKGEIVLFRPEENFKRMNDSCERMSIPKIDVDFCVEAVKQLVTLEKDWVPTAPNTSLYIRPFIFATDIHVGVHASHTYQFAVILSPVGPYYATGLAPVSIMIEEDDVRAVRGGTGFTKCAGNYAASILAGAIAEEKGFSQVLWLDGVEKKYIGEVGAMNIFFVVDGEVLTPELDGSILSGITRKSMIQILRDKGYKVTERKITIQEIADAYDAGKLQEVFGTGTAAVISPVGQLEWGDKIMKINNGKIGDISMYAYKTLTDIQWGRAKGPEGWSVEIGHE
jgi:branched-chain amino acid aminotransferase